MTRGATNAVKKTTTKTKPPNTLLSSQTTPLRPRNKPHGYWPLTRLRTTKDPPKWSFPLGHRRARRTDRVATTCPSYATGNEESNNLLSGMFRVAQDQLTRSTPAIFRLPRRKTSQRPCRKSVWSGGPVLVVDLGVVDRDAARSDRAPASVGRNSRRNRRSAAGWPEQLWVS